MKFGQTRVLQTAKGKIAVGIALIVLGIRQDRTEKNQFRDYSKEAK